MADFSIDVDGYTIEIDTSSWNGSEAISYDRAIVSKKRSFMYLTAHSFKATENGESVTYKVNVITGLTSHGYIVWRNGIILAHEP